MLPDGGIFSADPSGKVRLEAATPGAGLVDGLVLAGGDYYFTSWIANGVFRIGANGRGLEMLFELESPASLGSMLRTRLQVEAAAGARSLEDLFDRLHGANAFTPPAPP